MGGPVDHHLFFTSDATSLTHVGSNRRIDNAENALSIKNLGCTEAKIDKIHFCFIFINQSTKFPDKWVRCEAIPGETAIIYIVPI
jgi:hypothetical protein